MSEHGSASGGGDTRPDPASGGTLRRLAAGIGWRHALGELVLIIAGVLIALAVNDWSQGRRDRRSEAEALGEIRTALGEDLADIRSDLARHRLAAAAAEAILGGWARPTACDSVGPRVAALLSVPYHVSNTAAYESVKARGLGLIAEDSLRLAIIHLYAYRNAVIDVANALGNRFVEEVLRPYVRERFTLDGAAPAPRSCAALAGDPAFRNLLAEELALRRYAISRYEPAEAEIQGLVAAIDRR